MAGSDLHRFVRSRRVGSLSVLQGYRLLLTDLLGLWDVFQAWTSEIDGHFGRLNDQVGGLAFCDALVLEDGPSDMDVISGCC